MSYRILLVDDEEMIKLSMRKILTETHPAFVIVGEAMDGQEALEIAEREQPHVIITDISMPVMDGLEFIRAVHEKGWNPKIIILSGYSEFDYARQALRFGVADYILKPMRASAVKELLLEMYRKHLEKLEASATKSNLMSHCLNHANVLFEEIWKVDTAGVKKATDEVLDLIVSYELPDELRKDILLDLTAVMRRQAEERGTALVFDLVWREHLGDLFREFREMLLTSVEQVRNGRNWGKYSVIKKGIEVIHSRFSDPAFKLDELLHQLNLSVTHFYNLFKQETGKSFMTYLIEYRMEQAKQLLVRKELKTYEVGERVGYPDYPHFTKVFKKIVGVTPSEYRKNIISHQQFEIAYNDDEIHN
ncbi:two-component system, response regulator YesN [Paenibacillus sp. yr247]|uniref:response regulator transcription factor n=1 Tax=Paenibacillus sp. yr247 TaxID=1761880 RepID=UPI00088E7581|nr:response regulator [Paenibacillus sp. yr247]SDO34952.1 two-component system, response regulator YesN [Paenibacillus sp. yr247]